VERIQAYKFRLKVTPPVEQLFRQFAGCCRYVYNKALRWSEERLKNGERRPTYAHMNRELTKWRNDPETPWLYEGSSTAQQYALKNLDRAYVNFYQKRASAPALKKKGVSRDSFQLTAITSTIGTDRIRLPKIGWVKFFASRAIEGTPKNIYVSCRNGKWYLSIQTEREVCDRKHQSESVVGLDLGVSSLVTVSIGEVVPPINPLRSSESKLKRLRRRMSRKVRFSKNWVKAKRKVAKLHEKAANIRLDYLHKLTTNLSKNHATIVVEDLKVKNMTASAQGTVDKPGKMVKQKAGLNKAILDQGWGELVRQLDYKIKWNGGRLVKINPAYTSQTCSSCGHCERDNRPTQSKFSCLLCGFSLNADVNAARNILAAGRAVLACGALSVDDAVKQESTSES
jgi:putative transposase